MRIVLLSGGSGQRLWPISGNDRPKQFLQVLDDGAGGLESMAQRTWRQLDAAGLRRCAYVSAGQAQKELVLGQLGPDVPLILEPERRDTFPAIALACAYLHAESGAAPEEVVGILPIDSYADIGYFRHIRRLEPILAASGADLALLGGKPTYPSEKYGYIIPKRTTGRNGKAPYPYAPVARFVEKPKAADAERFIRRGALWNCGVFAFRLGFLLDLLRSRGFATDYAGLLRQYGRLPKISFDYEVMEQAASRRTVVQPYAGDWKDLGTWNTLTEEMGQAAQGGPIYSRNCTDTHLINELGIPLAAIGLSNVVVACSPRGILVSEKSASSAIKELLAEGIDAAADGNAGWGRIEPLHETEADDGGRAVTRKLVIEAGCSIVRDAPGAGRRSWTVLAGTGAFAGGGRIRRIRSGDVLRLTQGGRHALHAVGRLVLIEVQLSRAPVEAERVRAFRSWDEALRQLDAGAE